MKQIKYGHMVRSSKILQLVWWGQRWGTRVRWRADRGSEVIGKDSKGEKKKLRMDFVHPRPLSLPKFWSHVILLLLWGISNSAPAVCISHSLPCELLHVPGQGVPSPCRWRCQPCRPSSQYPGWHPIILNMEITLKNLLLKCSNQKQSCNIQTACIFIRFPLVCVCLTFSLLISTYFTEDKHLKGSIQTHPGEPFHPGQWGDCCSYLLNKLKNTVEYKEKWEKNI